MYDSNRHPEKQEQLIAFEKSCNPETIIFKQWDKSTEMYILLQGKVSVFVDGIEVAVIDEPGSYFGEMSALLDKPRTATIKTITPCKLLVVKHDMVEEFLAHSPKLGMKLTKILAQRLKETTEDLIEMSQLVSSGREISKKMLKKIESLKGDSTGLWRSSSELSKEIKDYSDESKAALIHITRRSRELQASKGNKSTYSERYRCFFHETDKFFNCYTLKQKTQVVRTNVFDTFVYKAAVPGQQYCNYLLIEVQVCPECHFATNVYSHFCRYGEQQEPPTEFNQKVMAAMAERTKEREAIAHSFSARFYTIRRSHHDAIKAFELAALCYDTIATARTKPHGLSLCRAGNFYLKAAHLAIEKGNLEEEEKFLRQATAYLEKSYLYLAGPNLIRTIYQLVALYIFWGDFEAGLNLFNYLQKMASNAMVPAHEKKFVDKYLNMTRRIWQDREEMIQSRLSPSQR